MDLKKINQKIKNFVKERDWDQFHSPKNLSMALSVEASELVEIFQWLKESDFKK
jgi:NTP pyrophosphatase (non-canonical NTP hydrolase)